MSEQEQHMRRALRLAQRGRGKVSPNPMVGAVLVRAGRIVGEGAHLAVGGPHAEVNAFARAGDAARGAELYVTLEPCSFHGRTPPCTEAVLRAGVERVYCAMRDPDERVGGRGIAALRAKGLAVEVGLCEEEARQLNAAYVKHRTQGLPLVLLKLAQTLDGRIAATGGDARWITGEKARRHAHRWRSWVDGLMVGAGTVRADDPLLTVRHVKGRDPRPLVVDGRLSTSPEARVYQRPGAVLITAKETPAAQREAYTATGTEVWTFPGCDGRIDLRMALKRAAQEGMTSVLIEGGGTLAASALNARVVDQVQLYLAPRLMGRGVEAIGDLGVERAAEAIRLESVRTRRLGPDLLYTAEVQYPCSQD
jgi:diaminohydroxyphosphoribosylaminopyrimidine deaminase/5-amino-6-(5-phosphoribosylamino)uracil reductase